MLRPDLRRDTLALQQRLFRRRRLDPGGRGRKALRPRLSRGRLHSAATGSILGPLSSSTLPAVAGDVAYMLSETTLSAVANAGLGATLWSFTGDGHLTTAPIVVGDVVFVGSSYGRLYGLDAQPGRCATRSSRAADLRSGRALPDRRFHGRERHARRARRQRARRLPERRSDHRGAREPLAADHRRPGAGPGALAADVGIWTNLPTSYAYAWQRCDGAGAKNCTDIAGATGMSFKPAEPDIGARFRVRVTASNASGAADAIVSAPSAAVTSAPRQLDTPPSIAGMPHEGSGLVANPGTWLGSPSSYHYAWQRCSTGFFPGCSDIEGATQSSYVAVAADVAYRLRVRVVATNAAGDSDPALSAQTDAATVGPPVALQAPSYYSGMLYVAEQLSAGNGVWTNNPTSFRHQWFSCDPAGTSCPDIAGATQPTYVLRDADLGRFVGVEVVARNAAGDSQPQASQALGPVSPAIPKNVTGPSISGVPRAGSTLTANPGTWTANPTQFSPWWYRCDVDYDSCTFTGTTGKLLPARVGGRRPTPARRRRRHERRRRVRRGALGARRPDRGRRRAPAPPVAPPQPPQPPATNAFTVVSQTARRDGSLVFKLRAPRKGVFAGVATASASALRDPCRPGCSASRRSPFGRKSVSIAAAGTVTLVVKPNVRARAALRRRGNAIAIRVQLTFKPSFGRSSSQVRSLTVRRRQAANRSLRVSSGARQRGLPSIVVIPRR